MTALEPSPAPASATAGRLRISVVVPCHNYGRFLTEAVESLMAQSRAADEILIVDDGSTDETALVVADLQARHRMIRAVRHDRALGAVATFNEGIRSTTGDAVMLLSADDRLSPRYLELSEQALVAGADIAFTPAQLFGNETGLWDVPPFDAKALLLHNSYHGSSLYRRWLFDHAGGYRQVLYEDWDLWVAGVLAGARGVRVDGCWLEYRRHGTSRSTMARWRGHIERLRIWWAHRGALGWGRLLGLTVRLAAEIPGRLRPGRKRTS
jgi:hypothetical protein